MKRNIITTINFEIGQVSVTVLEKLSTNTVELFNVSSGTERTHAFLERTFKEINVVIGGKLTDVTVVIAPTAKTNANVAIHQEEIQLAGNEVAELDIHNILKLTKRRYENVDQKVILVQPIKFDVFDVMLKSYDKAPIHKKGDKLIVTSSVTTISTDAYDFINQTVKSHGLNISQILLKPQTITQNNMSEHILKVGAVMVHIGKNQSYVTINKNLSTLSLLNIFDYGYNNLIKGVAKVFGTTKEEAKNLLIVYGTLDQPKTNCVIFTRQEGINERIFYAADLRKILVSFYSKLFSVAKKYIEQKGVSELPIVLSSKTGKVTGLEEFSKDYLTSEHISVYHPISYIELNDNNIEALGMKKFMARMDEQMGVKYNTIVETNPHSIASLNPKKKNKKWFAKIADKIGEKYDWN
ncbi:MAG: hypothetical protein KAG04_01185 [Mycoplasmataceae bacterium]|nr:hypothetical protein [Mycoplasmataceae bacterium]